MASYTTNYNLKKPAGTDLVKIADLNGNTAEFVTSCDQMALFRKDQDIGSAIDHLLSILDALSKAGLLIDQRSHQFCGIDLAACHGVKVTAVFGEILINQGVCIIDPAHCCDGVGAQTRTNQHRLRVGVADAADCGNAVHFLENMLNLRTEG